MSKPELSKVPISLLPKLTQPVANRATNVVPRLTPRPGIKRRGNPPDDGTAMMAKSYRTDIPNTLNRALYTYINGQIVRKNEAVYGVPLQERILQDAIDAFTPERVINNANFVADTRKLKALDNQRVVQEYISKPIRDKERAATEKREDELRKKDRARDKDIRKEFFKRLNNHAKEVADSIKSLEKTNINIARVNQNFQRELQAETAEQNSTLAELIAQGRYEEIEGIKRNQIEALRQERFRLLTELENSYRMLRDPATDPNNRDNFLQLTPAEAGRILNNRQLQASYLREQLGIGDPSVAEEFGRIVKNVDSEIETRAAMEEEERLQEQARLAAQERARLEAERAQRKQPSQQDDDGVKHSPFPPPQDPEDDDLEDIPQTPPSSKKKPKNDTPATPKFENFKSRLYLVPTTGENAEIVRIKKTKGASKGKYLEVVPGKNKVYDGFTKSGGTRDFNPGDSDKFEFFNLEYLTDAQKRQYPDAVKVKPLIADNNFVSDNKMEGRQKKIDTLLSQTYQNYQVQDDFNDDELED